jgi:hypothetical protein
MIADASEIQVRAERRLRELLQERERRGTKHSKGGGSKCSKREQLLDAPPTLTEQGIQRWE